MMAVMEGDDLLAMEGCEGKPGADEVEMVLCMAMVGVSVCVGQKCGSSPIDGGLRGEAWGR